MPVKTVPALADGNYFLVAQVTDPFAGGTSIASSPAPIAIAAPFITLSAAFAATPVPSLKSGATVILTNNGNIDDVTLIDERVGFATDVAGQEPVGSSLESGTIGRQTIKAHRSIKLHLSGWKLVESSLTPGSYFLTAILTDEAANRAVTISSMAVAKI